MNITLPPVSLVLLVGPSGVGKSTFARRHFKPTEVISSDYFRGLISDDENEQSINAEAFELLHSVVDKRLAFGRLTVVDATNVQFHARKPLLDIAQKYHTPAVAIVFALPEQISQERNQQRNYRTIPRNVVKRHHSQLLQSLPRLKADFEKVFVLESAEQMDSAVISREASSFIRPDWTGPFDIIGDVHGCMDELNDLLKALGYQLNFEAEKFGISHPENRKLLFVGDLVDRGPCTPEVLRLVMDLVQSGSCLCVRGNHDDKLFRKLSGRNVQISHGLETSLEQLEKFPVEFSNRVRDFLGSLPYHYVLDGGRLVIAHAGLKEEFIGKVSDRVRTFALFGDITGEKDADGLPVRLNWAADYRGKARIIYGHTPTGMPRWVNNTINIDTGCVFGGSLTAVRYPEGELISIPARREYAITKRNFKEVVEEQTPQKPIEETDDLPNLADLLGRRWVDTRLISRIPIHENLNAAALEAMSRFAVDPRWLIYLPPTMSPGDSTKQDGYLEHPKEAFDYFAAQNITRVICERKHMGSRAVVVICKDSEVAQRLFGASDDCCGICYTRTGRRFFDRRDWEQAFLDRLRAALNRADFWRRFESDWFCIDGEMMPWSAKAQELLKLQYAACGASGRAALEELQSLWANVNEEDLVTLKERYLRKTENIQAFTKSYRQYCWPTQSIDDFRFAPFHLLAGRKGLFLDQEHSWHMDVLAELSADPIFLATPYLVVNPKDPASTSEGTEWWLGLTGEGYEGMVVKPMQWINPSQKSLVQPALKVRGREYLRLIYGADYTLPENLTRLKQRAIAKKRALAVKEFALGIESLERFVRGDSLRKIHEAVFGVLALESDPVDARL